MVKQFKKIETFKIISADKNCGFALIETEHLTEHGILEHLNDEYVSQRISKQLAYSYLYGVKMMLQSLYSKWQNVMSEAEHTYLKRGVRKYSVKLSRFYTTVKMHKNPYKFRPIVTTCGTALSVLSCSLDYKLQQLKPFIETYIAYSNELREKLNSLGLLLDNAKLFKADANSMYTNIDIEYGL